MTGAELATLRKAAGLTQDELAEKVGLPGLHRASMIAKFESGHRRISPVLERALHASLRPNLCIDCRVAPAAVPMPRCTGCWVAFVNAVKACTNIPERWQQVLLAVERGATLEEVGQAHGVSREMARRLVGKARKALAACQ